MADNRITLDSKTVRILASVFLARREAMISQKREELIAEEMKERSTWWGLHKVGPFTREQAIERLKKDQGDDLCSPWDYVELEGGAWKVRAEKLIRASNFVEKNANEFDHVVCLGDDDVWMLGGFE